MSLKITEKTLNDIIRKHVFQLLKEQGMSMPEEEWDGYQDQVSLEPESREDQGFDTVPGRQDSWYKQHGRKYANRTARAMDMPGPNAGVVAVRAAQSLAKEMGFLEEKDIDGKYGPKTLKAITALQRKLGVNPDGIVGKETLAAYKRTQPTGDPLAPQETPTETGPPTVDQQQKQDNPVGPNPLEVEGGPDANLEDLDDPRAKAARAAAQDRGDLDARADAEQEQNTGTDTEKLAQSGYCSSTSMRNKINGYYSAGKGDANEYDQIQRYMAARQIIEQAIKVCPDNVPSNFEGLMVRGTGPAYEGGGAAAESEQQQAAPAEDGDAGAIETTIKELSGGRRNLLVRLTRANKYQQQHAPELNLKQRKAYLTLVRNGMPAKKALNQPAVYSVNENKTYERWKQIAKIL